MRLPVELLMLFLLVVTVLGASASVVSDTPLLLLVPLIAMLITMSPVLYDIYTDSLKRSFIKTASDTELIGLFLVHSYNDSISRTYNFEIADKVEDVVEKLREKNPKFKKALNEVLGRRSYCTIRCGIILESTRLVAALILSGIVGVNRDKVTVMSEDIRKILKRARFIDKKRLDEEFCRFRRYLTSSLLKHVPPSKVFSNPEYLANLTPYLRRVYAEAADVKEIVKFITTYGSSKEYKEIVDELVERVLMDGTPSEKTVVMYHVRPNVLISPTEPGKLEEVNGEYGVRYGNLLVQLEGIGEDGYKYIIWNLTTTKKVKVSAPSVSAALVKAVSELS